MSIEEKQSNLSLQGVIGFNGEVPQGLLLHQDDERLIYPLGSTIIVKYLTQKKQFFLQKDGHDHSVSCLALSPSGRYLASGQNAPMGFPAVVVIWDLDKLQAVHRLSLHKGKVQSLAFSPNETYLATLGGRDDNKLIIWDVKSGEALCGSPASNEVALVVKYLHGREDALVTGGINNLRTWEFDRANRKVRPTDCSLGQMKRNVQCIAVDNQDEFMYCGTSTGDILKVSLGPKVVKTLGPPKRPFSLGISSVALTGKGNLIVGTGDGVVATINKDSMTVIKQTQIPGHVTSLQLNKAGDHFFVGTQQCTIHLVHLQTLAFELRNSCHGGRINDVAFPAGYSELFVTASLGDIRVWQAATCSELLRVQVPNVECLSVCFSADGSSIISGWADGKIRAFGPQTGKQLYVLNDAHAGGVTVVTGTRNSKAVVSGGRDGQVRVWSIAAEVQRMVGSMKEHKGTINSIVLSADDTQCISASDDGSCIVWDLERQARANCLFATTQFRSAVYHPDQSQIVTTGTDRKITYWDAVDGQPIRILEGSASSELNTISISTDGERFVVGGGDKAVKIYGYDEGICQFRGVGHSGSVTKVCMAPNGKFVVSVGDEGAIFVWQMPEESASRSAEVPAVKVPSPVKGDATPSKSKGSASSSPRLKESADISARLKTSLRV